MLADVANDGRSNLKTVAYEATDLDRCLWIAGVLLLAFAGHAGFNVLHGRRLRMQPAFGQSFFAMASLAGLVAIAAGYGIYAWIEKGPYWFRWRK